MFWVKTIWRSQITRIKVVAKLWSAERSRENSATEYQGAELGEVWLRLEENEKRKRWRQVILIVIQIDKMKPWFMIYYYDDLWH